MSLQNLALLILLSAIWGGSFLFMRIASPVLGPAFLAEGRVFFGALFLLILSYRLKKNRNILKHLKHFGILGLFSFALPFIFFSTAASKLSASELSIINATSPIWTYLIAIVIKNEKFLLKKLIGLIFGFMGVVVIFYDSLMQQDHEILFAAMLGLSATFCYGIATNYAKKSKKLDPFRNAHGSMWLAFCFLIPTLFFLPIKSEITLSVAFAIIMLGIVCSGIAYLIYFKLIEEVGATSALIPTFIVPIFATFFGFIFLDEKITGNIIFGMMIVIFGTIMATQFKKSPKPLLPKID